MESKVAGKGVTSQEAVEASAVDSNQEGVAASVVDNNQEVVAALEASSREGEEALAAEEA